MPIEKQQEPDYFNRLRRYRLVVRPAAEMAEILIEEKRKFSREYQLEGEISAPLVVLTEFLAKDEMEETIIRWLQRITGEHRSFAITLNNFGGCPAHSVFLRILDHEPLRDLARQLQPIDQYVRRNDCPPVRFMVQPYLPIAENLTGTLYDRVIGDYSRRDFHGSFEVTELMLVRASDDGGSSVRRAVLRLQPGHQLQN
ncbi:MAG: hypothetical protein ABWZ25_08200 [Chitinophagaceae bacterium]